MVKAVSISSIVGAFVAKEYTKIIIIVSHTLAYGLKVKS